MSFGNRGGRPPKPKKLHILEGSFRKDRHSSPGDSVSLEGEVIVPEMNELAMSLWKSVVAPLIALKVVTPADVPAAQAMCESWSLMRRTLAALDNDACDKLARTAYTAYGVMFDKFAARFGMTPADRQRLRLEKPEEKNKLSKYTG